MKLEILSREVSDITITDNEVLISMSISMSHGSVRKSVTSITVEHVVEIEPWLPGMPENEGTDTNLDDAIALAVAGVKARSDTAVTALRGLSSL